MIEIQSRIFDLGAAIATPVNSSSEEKLKYTQVSIHALEFVKLINSTTFAKFPSVHLLTLEAWIDELDGQLSPLTNFVLPVSSLFDLFFVAHVLLVVWRTECHPFEPCQNNL